MKLMLQLQALVLLALLAATPEDAAAAKDKTAFTMDIEVCSCGLDFWAGDFKSRGAIRDHGSARTGFAEPVLPHGYDLVGDVRGSRLRVVIDYGDVIDQWEDGDELTGTFVIYEDSVVLGSGTATGTIATHRYGDEVSWHLTGTLSDG